ncbi:MAG: hypothetical protein WDZ59_09480 [Pirellulales bacterium]
MPGTKKVIITTCLALIAIWNIPAAPAAIFTGLGHLPGGGDSRGMAVSDDGLVVSGWSSSFEGTEAIRWTMADGMVSLGDLPGSSVFSRNLGAISSDGSVIAGEARSSDGTELFRWTMAEGMVGLGDLDGGGFNARGFAISGDGSVIAGRSNVAAGIEAFRWTDEDGLVGLGDLAGGTFHSDARGISADGAVIAGQSESGNGSEAFRWTMADGLEGLGDLSGGGFSSFAQGISPDGTVVVGEGLSASGPEAFRWTEAEGMVGLDDLPGGAFQSRAFDASENGEFIVGFSAVRSEGSPFERDAFIWDADNGMRNLNEVLTDLGVDLGGWTLVDARSISPDGRYIAGFGRNPAGQIEGWHVDLQGVPIPEPSTGLLAGSGLVIALVAALRRRRSAAR